MMSASYPAAIAPFRSARPASRAGATLIHSTTCSTRTPRKRALVHTADSANWSDAMPPQHPKKFPSDSFIDGGHGEWSDATRSMSPSISASHNAALSPDERIGGAHLNSVAPSGISSAANVR